MEVGLAQKNIGSAWSENILTPSGSGSVAYGRPGTTRLITAKVFHRAPTLVFLSFYFLQARALLLMLLQNYVE